MSTTPACNPSRTPQHNLCIVQGQDGDGIRVPLVNSVTSLPIDPTGWIGRAQVRETYDGDLIDEFEVLCDSTGIIVTWTGLQTSFWPSFDVAVWDLEVVDLAGMTYRVVEGKVYLSREVTR